MSNIKKLMMSAAGAGGGLNVEDVFSTYTYEGSSAARDIENGIDLSSEGGLIWTKQRNSTEDNWLVDTERGINEGLKTNATSTADLGYSNVTAFNTDGYSLGIQDVTNESPGDFVSWTFRKAPKFFDVVTYTGNGTAGRTVSHNLGSVPGCIFVKALSSGQSWAVYHRGVASDAETDYLVLNDTNAAVDNALYWNDTAPTASNFTVGTRNNVNGNGITYVAYLFAHNDGDGEFGPNADQDIIKCGSYTGDTSGNGFVNLGFEPQFILVKRTDGTTGWFIFDNIRGWTADGTGQFLSPNQSHQEFTSGNDLLTPTATGFSLGSNSSTALNYSGANFIYMAIRRGPMAVPESATDVFAIDTKTDDPRPAFISNFPVDMALWRRKHTTSNWSNTARLIQGKFLYTNSTASEGSNSINAFDYQDGWYDDQGADNRILSWMWRRSHGFFDVVAYTGNSTTTWYDHNLGAVPEMMWIKARNNNEDWVVYHKNRTGANKVLHLNTSQGEQTVLSPFDIPSTPTDTQFRLGTNSRVNSNGINYLAYLFASLDGVSKVGSYTGTSTTQTIDCGFSSGARFVLIKRTDASDDWYLYDSERGIVSGNDNLLLLNTTGAESTMFDFIDPQSSGFSLPNSGSFGPNVTGASYIFYAIA